MNLTKYRRKLYRLFAKKTHFAPAVLATRSLGTDYGGWVVPGGFITAQSVCYLAGAGTDISFDVALAETYGCKVCIFDPTPRAQQHFFDLVNATKNGKKMPINPQENYEITEKTLPLLEFHTLGLWDKPDVIKFFAPENSQHVSHSAVNLQHTNTFFEASVDTIKNIMKKLNHTCVDLLKIDIEGAEYVVLDNFLAEKPDVKVICVEFDEINHPQGFGYMRRIGNYINKMQAAGYVLFALDKNYNASFVRQDVYQTLTQKP
jgi:FkbM family methyltransferase